MQQVLIFLVNWSVGKTRMKDEENKSKEQE